MSKKTTWILVVCLVIFACLVAQVLIRREVNVDIEIIDTPDFTIEVDEITYPINRGMTIELFVTATFLNRFDGKVFLSTEDLPVGVTATFTHQPLMNEPDPDTGGTLLQTVMTIVVAEDAPLGIFTFKVIGTEVNE